MDRQKNWHCSKETGNGKLDSTNMVSCATQGIVKIVGYEGKQVGGLKMTTKNLISYISKFSVNFFQCLFWKDYTYQEGCCTALASNVPDVITN